MQEGRAKMQSRGIDPHLLTQGHVWRREKEGVCIIAAESMTIMMGRMYHTSHKLQQLSVKKSSGERPDIKESPHLFIYHCSIGPTLKRAFRSTWIEFGSFKFKAVLLKNNDMAEKYRPATRKTSRNHKNTEAT